MKIETLHLALHALTFHFLLHADIRKQSTAGLWCLDYPVHGCDIGIWRLMRSYYGVVTYVLCWCTKWSYAIDVSTHKHQHFHTGAISGFSGMAAKWNHIEFEAKERKQILI